MKYSLILTLLLIMACSQNQSAQKNDLDSQSDKQSTQLNITTKFVTGQFDFTKRDDFVQVDSQYVNRPIYLHEKTYKAFKAMADSAKKDGITLTIISGTRNFNDQKGIWERKWEASKKTTPIAKAKEILNWSSMPMTSRHHWGTDMDLNNLENSYFESGYGQKVYDWLGTHANSFGFYQPYTDKSINGRTGYNMEKWHWSYTPLSCQYLAYYNSNMTNEDITGFKGSETAVKLDMVKNYVNGISQRLKKACK